VPVQPVRFRPACDGVPAGSGVLEESEARPEWRFEPRDFGGDGLIVDASHEARPE
jgi:hypothetical protein